MRKLTAGELSIDLTDQERTLLLTWRGKSTDRYPQRILEPFLTPILEEAARDEKTVEMRLESLGHFNSSTIGCLIQVIQDARAQKVKLVLVYDASLSWQRLSFDALRVFTRDNELLELRSSTP